jgi:CubicO group peptidase (beta-lactamase class C family)
LSFKFRPGQGFSYSGEGFVYLQTVVEKLVGEPLSPWLENELLKPLGMSDSGYVWRSSMKERAVSGHKSDGSPDRFRKFSKPRTSHTLLTTAPDLAKAMAFMIKPQIKSEWLPTEATVRMMLRPQVSDKRRAGVARGLGWAMQESPRFFYHTGSNGGGHRACAIASVASQKGVVVLTNSPNGKEFYRELVQAASGPQPAMQV